MDKVYELTARDIAAFNCFQADVLQQKKIIVKYDCVGNQNFDEDIHFFDYDEIDVHQQVFDNFTEYNIICYLIEDISNVAVVGEHLNVNGMEYNQYYFRKKDEETPISFLSALRFIKYKCYRSYPFYDNQSLWISKASALYVNKRGKQCFNEIAGHYQINGERLTLQAAAMYGMLDVMAPPIYSIANEFKESGLAQLTTSAHIAEEINQLLWNTHRLGYAYTLYIYFEVDQEIAADDRIPISFYVVLDGDAPFKERLFQDYQLYQNQISKTDARTRTIRAESYRKAYYKYCKENGIEEKICMISQHVSYDGERHVVVENLEIISQKGAIDYSLDFDIRCYHSLKQCMWKI